MRLRFGLQLRELLAERPEFLTRTGNVNYQAFWRTMDGWSYESLRKAIGDDRAPTVELMEAVARALNVDPSVFYEWELAQVRRSFDVGRVGIDEALKNLEAWSAHRETSRARNSQVSARGARKGHLPPGGQRRPLT